MKRLLVALIAIWTAVCQIQTTGPTSGFEVVSIKPSESSGTGTRTGVTPGGMFTAKNVSVKDLIQQAYDVRGFQVSGGPGWLDTQRYDIVAKGNAPGVSDDELRKMTDEQRDALRAQFLLKVQLLLADRFQLRLHHEMKELPVYALIVARNGPRISAATDSDVTRSGLSVRTGDAGKTEITATRLSLTNLVKALSNQVGRIVLDKTGLNGNYDFKLTFTPDMGQTSGNDGLDSGGPSVFTALQEQLGLRLDSLKGPVEVVVIDSVQKASEN